MVSNPKELTFQVLAFHHFRSEVSSIPQTRLGSLIEVLPASCWSLFDTLLVGLHVNLPPPSEPQTVGSAAVETQSLPVGLFIPNTYRTA